MTQRDHTHHGLKLAVRLHALDLTASHDPVRVLDAFAGQGRLWRDVAARSHRRIHTTAVDTRPDAPPGTIRADNRKVMAGADLDSFDVVDLDAYGVPGDQLAAASTARTPVVVVTCIKSGQPAVPHRVLTALGMPREWMHTAPTAVSRLGWLDLWDGFCHTLGYRHRLGYTVHDGAMMKRYDILLREPPP